MTISVDGASVAPLERVGAEPYLDLTNGATLLFVNDAQAAVLTGRDDPMQAIRVLTAWYPHVVVKLGPEGAVFANGRPDPVRAPPSRSSTSWTAPAAVTRSAPGSSSPGWTRSRRWRHWPAAAASRRAPWGWSAPGPRSDRALPPAPAPPC